MGGSLVIWNDIVSLSYSDISSGNCPVIVTRTFTLIDSCNIIVIDTQSISIQDTVLPTATNPAPITVACLGDLPVADVNVVTDAADNCTTPTVTFVSDLSDNQTCPETITRTYRVTDACNNSITVTQSISVQGDILPILSSAFDTEIHVLCEDIPTIPSLDFVGNCSENMSIVFNETINQINNLNYNIIREWIVFDECNNQNKFVQTVYVASVVETDRRYLELCIEDGLLNLNSFITNTNNTSNNWESGSVDLIDGYFFDPSKIELGVYDFQYVYSNNGCVWQTNLEIEVNDNCVYYPCIKSSDDVTISKLVSANNDGNNDYLEVNYILNQDSNEPCDISIQLEIYNRWGAKVYENNNYDNQWSGESPNHSVGGSNKLPSGTYYYVVRLKNSGLEPIQNYILLGTD